MRERYRDIKALTSTPPLWFDEAGAPRYVPFEPYMANNQYAAEVALLRIRCQACRTEFLAAVSRTSSDPPLRPQAESGTIEYGDPPECCEQGRTMSSQTMEVVEFWNLNGRWKRDRSLEWSIMPAERR